MIEDIEKIIKIFENAKITKLNLELSDMKISLEKDKVEAKVIYKTASEEQESEPEDTENHVYITSPVVGTFYAQRSEKADPFVKVGQKVKKGDVLCIVEAMKVMNEVQSDKDGVISKVLVNNGDLVMYGQNLFEIGESND